MAELEKPDRAKLERSAEEARLAGREEDALSRFEDLIQWDLRAGQIAKAVSVYQRVVLWKPELREVHSRLARRIGEARESTAAGGAVPASAASAVPASPLFQGIPPEQVPEILQSMKPRRFSAGEEVVREGDAGDSLFLITEGAASVHTRDEDGSVVSLATLGSGDFFGEVSLLTSRPRTATVRAESPVEALELTREGLGILREKVPGIEQALSEFHGLRAQRTIESILARRRPPLL
ncbi:MAG: cyclic nucleotide-binding domain-containing protein [Thermoanaerobaculia bacterium]